MGKLTDEDLKVHTIVEGADASRDDINKLSESITNQTAKLKLLQKELKNMERLNMKGTENYREQKVNIQKLTDVIEANKKSLATANGNLKLTDKTLEELNHELKLSKSLLNNAIPGSENWVKLNQKVLETKNRIRVLNSQSNASQGVLARLSKSATGAVAMIGVVFRTVTRLFQGLARAFGKIADFEQANANLSTIVGKNISSIKQLTNSALELGRTTEYTASQVTELQTELAKLGFKEDAITQMQKAVLHFATAVGSNLPDAAAMAGSTLRMFDLDANQADDTLGVLTKGCNNSALSFSYLQTAMSIVGPVAKTFGFSLRDTTALLGTLANSGFDASSAATATRNILLNLANANGKLAKALGEPVKTFPELMNGLEKLNGQGIDLASTLELTDKRSVSAFNAFLRGADSAIILRDSLDNVNGILETTAKERLNTVEGSIKLLKSAWEGFILSFNNSKGVIKDVIDFLTSGINGITDLLGGGKKKNGSDKSTSQRGEWLMGKMWNDSQYWSENKLLEEDGVSKLLSDINKQIDDQQYHINSINLDAVVGRVNKKKAIKEVNQMKDYLNMLLEAREDYFQRVQWMEGTYKPTDAENQPNGSDPTDLKAPGLSWSLSSDKSYLAAKAELTRKYNDGEIQTQEDYDDQIYDLEVASLTARLALGKESGADREKLQLELQEKIKKHNEDEMKEAESLAEARRQLEADLEDDKTTAALDAEDARYEAETKKYAGHADLLELAERKHQAKILDIRSDAQDRTLEAMKSAHDLEHKELENSWDESIAATDKGSAEYEALQKQKATALAKDDLIYLEQMRVLLEKITESGQIDGLAIPSDKLQQLKMKLQEIIAEINKTKSAMTDGSAVASGREASLFGVSQAQWNQFFNNLKDGKLAAEDVATAINGISGVAQEGFSLASSAIEMVNAKEEKALKSYQDANEKKKKSLQKRLDAGMITQEQYDAEVTRMDEEQDAYEEELSVKKAEREKKMNIAQATMQTALSVMKTYNEWGGWPAGVAPAAIMGALGAAQIALIAATPVTGAEEGGIVNVNRRQDGRRFSARLSPDKRGYVASPTVIVGENGSEYVIPHDGLENPSIAPYIDAIETARRQGQLKNLNLAAINPQAAITGRSSGGYISEGTAPKSQTSASLSSEAVAQNKELLAMLKKMNDTLSRPITASVSMLGRGGIVEKTKEYNRQTKRGKLNG